MKFLLLFFFSLSAFGEISQVSSGDAIQAQKVNEIVTGVNKLESYLPVGSIIEVAGSCPAGFLSTNGQAVSRSAYPSLFSQIGVQFGAGDGSSTFNVPRTTKHYLGSIQMTNCGMHVLSTNFNNYIPGACTYSVSGDALTPATNVPGIRFAYLPAGKIVVHYAGALTNSRIGGAGSSALFRLIDGSNVSTNIVAVGAATAADNAINSIPGGSWEIIRSQAGTDVTIQFQAKVTSTASSSAGINTAYVIGNVDSVMSVYHYPNKEIKGNCIKH